MRVALVAPPFIPVPPPRYGGTELFIAHLAQGLKARGHVPVVYSIGESRVECEVRWREPRGHWPLREHLAASLEDMEHAGWACRDAGADCDLIHLNNVPGLCFAGFVPLPFVYTLHHPHEEALSRMYARLPEVRYVAISRNQAGFERGLRHLSVIHHGLDPARYRVGGGARSHLLFLGRIAPIKGVHTAIAVARRAGLPLKIAGEIQPIYQEYWERAIRPQVDGREIEYVGPAGQEEKNELLGGALALLFPIEWDEPFGLVMIEAMACGVPVLAFRRGSVPEVVADGVSGILCANADEMAAACRRLPLSAAACRRHVEAGFSLERMVDDYLSLYAGLVPAAPSLTEVA